MFSSVNKTFGWTAKFLVAATKNLFVVPNFVAVPKPFFPRAFPFRETTARLFPFFLTFFFYPISFGIAF